MTIRKIMEDVARHILATSKELDESELEKMVGGILGAKRIFLMGAGRSGLVAKAFAMRLSQMNFSVYVVGETITPGMRTGDLLIVVSGSGETKSVVSAAKVAKDVGADILSITSYAKSSIGIISDFVVTIRGKTKVDIEKDHLKHQIQGVHSSLTPLGTVFEDTAMIFLDAVIGKLMESAGKSESSMRERHATVE